LIPGQGTSSMPLNLTFQLRGLPGFHYRGVESDYLVMYHENLELVEFNGRVKLRVRGSEVPSEEIVENWYKKNAF